MVFYKVVGALEYLAITVCGIHDIKLAKKAFVLPGQRYTKFDMSSVNYTFEVQAMSVEKLPFILPAVFTIGPRVDSRDSLLLYAKLISPHDKLSSHVKELVQGVIEGKTCVLVASMTMEQILQDPNLLWVGFDPSLDYYITEKIPTLDKKNTTHS